MSTEMLKDDQVQSRDYFPEALTMALAILVERIRRLPDEDRNELYELMKALPSAESPEDGESIVVTMREILDQAPVRLQKVDLEGVKPSPKLQRWIDFVSKQIRELRTSAGLTQER